MSGRTRGAWGISCRASERASKGARARARTRGALRPHLENARHGGRAGASGRARAVWLGRVASACGTASPRRGFSPGLPPPAPPPPPPPPPPSSLPSASSPGPWRLRRPAVCARVHARRRPPALPPGRNARREAASELRKGISMCHSGCGEGLPAGALARARAPGGRVSNLSMQREMGARSRRPTPAGRPLVRAISRVARRPPRNDAERGDSAVGRRSTARVAKDAAGRGGGRGRLAARLGGPGRGCLPCRRQSGSVLRVCLFVCLTPRAGDAAGAGDAAMVRRASPRPARATRARPCSPRRARAAGPAPSPGVTHTHPPHIPPPPAPRGNLRLPLRAPPPKLTSVRDAPADTAPRAAQPGIDIWMPFIIIGGALTVQATILKYNYIAWHGKPRNAPGTKYGVCAPGRRCECAHGLCKVRTLSGPRGRPCPRGWRASRARHAARWPTRKHVPRREVPPPRPPNGTPAAIAADPPDRSLALLAHRVRPSRLPCAPPRRPHP